MGRICGERAQLLIRVGMKLPHLSSVVLFNLPLGPSRPITVFSLWYTVVLEGCAGLNPEISIFSTGIRLHLVKFHRFLQCLAAQ